MNRAILNFPARHSWITLAIGGMLAVFSIFSCLRLRADTSLVSLFPRNDLAASALLHVLDNFSSTEEMLILATTPGPQPDPPRLLAFADRLQREIQADPEASKLVTAVNYRADEQSKQFVTNVIVPNGVFYLSDTEFQAAMQRLTPDEMSRQLRQDEALLAAPGPVAGGLAKILLQDPLRLHEFIMPSLTAAIPFKTYQGSDAFLSADGRSMLIRLTGAKPPSDLDFCNAITSTVTALAGRANTDGLSLEFSGAYPIAARSQQAIRADSIASVIGSVACLAALFVVAFRRPISMFAVTFAPVALGALYGFGAYAMLNRNVTPLTAVIGAMLGGIGIDYSIFYVVNYLQYRAAGRAPVDAAGDTIGAIGGALVAAWVTSVVGFIAVGFASVPALRDFSILGSLGLAGALLGAMTILPALLVLLISPSSGTPGEGRGGGPLHRKPSEEPPPLPSPGVPGEGKKASPPTASPRFSIHPLLAWIDRHSRGCIAISACIFLAAVGCLIVRGPWLDLETDPTVLHPRPNPPLDAEAHIAQRMGTSPDSLIVYLRADSPEELLALAHRVHDRLATPAAKNAGIASTFGLASLLPDPAVAARRMSQLGPAVADRVIADFDAAVAKSSFGPSAFDDYRKFLRVLLTPKSAPGVSDLIPYTQLSRSLLSAEAVSGSAAPTEAITLVFLDRPLDTGQARQDCIAEVRALLQDLPGATVTGMSVLGLDTETTIHRDLPRLIIAAIVICAVYLLLHFRSLTQVVLAVLPTICSMTVLLAVAKIAGAKMNLANMVSIPLLIGIDVDYGIFLVSVTRRGTSRADLLNRAAASGQAVVLCATATLLGFGSLAWTSVPAVRSLGWAVGIGVATCAAAAMFFLLPILLWMCGRSNPTVESASVPRMP